MQLWNQHFALFQQKMAAQVSNVLNAVWKHPIVSCGILLLLLLPLFQVLVYFSPLLISTALCVAALVSIGPPAQKDEHDDTVSSKPPAHKEEKTWLGWFKCVEESARVWLESKFKIQERSSTTPDADLGNNAEEEPDSTSPTGNVHDIRVRQLERTLRSLSFVSYEGIFASDGTLLLDDPERNTEDEEHKNKTHVQGDEDSPEVDVAASQHDDIGSNGTARTDIPVGPPRAASTNEQQQHQSSRVHPSDMVFEDSSSWQEVEHEEPQ